MSALVVLHFAAAAAVTPPAVRAETAAAAAAVEARVIVDSNGCPTAVELWLTGTPDSIAGIEVALAWDRPDVAHFIEVITPASAADSAHGLRDSIADLLLPQGNAAQSEFEGGLLADWGYRQARLRTSISAKVVAVADFLRPDGATPIPAGATGLLFRLPVALRHTPVGAPSPDSVSLYLEPAQLRLSDKRGDLIDVAPPQTVKLGVTSCPALRPHR